MEDYFKVLGVPPGSNRDVVRSAFADLAKQYHPDKNPAGLKEFKRILLAYTALTGPNASQVFQSAQPTPKPTHPPHYEPEVKNRRMHAFKPYHPLAEISKNFQGIDSLFTLKYFLH